MSDRNDLKYMRRAVDLSKRGMGRTGVNPVVGAVIVKGGRLLGEGWHIKSRLDHAEIAAMKKVSPKRLKGAVLYVTLEPCCHTEKTTAPCTVKLIEAGFSRVVIATRDPNKKVNGKGIRTLRKAGMSVDVGLMKAEAIKVNEFYMKSINTSLPFVTLKHALSLDGKIAASDGSSKWISGKDSRVEVHRMRNAHDAVITTAITVKADNPSLGVRHIRGRDPLRIVVDWDLITETDAKVYRNDNVIVIADTGCDHTKAEAFEKMGIGVIKHDRSSGLAPLFRKFYAMGIGSVLVEAGGRFASRLMMEHLPHKGVYFVAPVILGGGGINAVANLGIENMASRMVASMEGAIARGKDIQITVYFK